MRRLSYPGAALHEECVAQMCAVAGFARDEWWLGSCLSAGVDCWIGVVQETDRRLVRLAGRLSVAQVPELLETCAQGHPIELNLADLVSADAAGIEALQRLRREGAALVAAPGYIQLKLDSDTGNAMSIHPPKTIRDRYRGR